MLSRRHYRISTRNILFISSLKAKHVSLSFSVSFILFILLLLFSSPSSSMPDYFFFFLLLFIRAFINNFKTKPSFFFHPPSFFYLFFCFFSLLFLFRLFLFFKFFLPFQELVLMGCSHCSVNLPLFHPLKNIKFIIQFKNIFPFFQSEYCRNWKLFFFIFLNI